MTWLLKSCICWFGNIMFWYRKVSLTLFKGVGTWGGPNVDFLKTTSYRRGQKAFLHWPPPDILHLPPPLHFTSCQGGERAKFGLFLAKFGLLFFSKFWLFCKSLTLFAKFGLFFSFLGGIKNSSNMKVSRQNCWNTNPKGINRLWGVSWYPSFLQILKKSCSKNAPAQKSKTNKKTNIWDRNI